MDQALCLFGWDRTPEVFCRMDSRMHGFEGDAENHCTLCLCVNTHTHARARARAHTHRERQREAWDMS